MPPGWSLACGLPRAQPPTVRSSVKPAPLVSDPVALISEEATKPQVHPEAIGRCRISQPGPCDSPSQGALENAVQTQGTSQPGQAQNSPQRVQANPLDLGRAQPPATPIQLEGRLNGRPVKFMLDSGAMGNFLSSEWLQQSGMRAAPRLSDKILQLPNGSQIPSHHFLPQAAVQLSSARASCPHMQERLHFDVADLQGYDAILGKPWLDKHNPTIDWKKHMVSVHKNGKTFVMQQRKPAAPSHAQRSAQDVKRDLLSAKQMQRLMRKKQGTFFVAYINEVQDLNATAQLRQPISSATASSSHQ